MFEDARNIAQMMAEMARPIVQVLEVYLEPSLTFKMKLF